MARQILWKKLFRLLAILFQGLKAEKSGLRFFQALFLFEFLGKLPNRAFPVPTSLMPSKFCSLTNLTKKTAHTYTSKLRRPTCMLPEEPGRDSNFPKSSVHKTQTGPHTLT